MKLRVFQQWSLPGLGGEELRVQPFDAPRPPRWTLLPPMYPIGYLDGWLFEPDSRNTLVEIYESLFGALALTGWSYDEIALAIRPALTTAFERKDLVVLAPRRQNAIRPVPYVVPVPGAPEKPQEDDQTWVAIELYQGKDPVPNEAFVITPPSGSPVSGKLDKDGFHEVQGILPGICKVEFPDIDAREWGQSMLSSTDAPRIGGEIVREEPDTTYVVKEGEDLFTIAKAEGFRNWQTIYRHEANASFRKKRPNPGVLFPGDELTIPGRKTKRETVGTGRTHRFYVHPPTRRLCLRLRDATGAAIADKRYTLVVDGSVINDQDTTSAGGEIREDIPSSWSGASSTSLGIASSTTAPRSGPISICAS
jgi:hypothetical protein